MLVQVENGQIIKWQLPKVGQLKDGRTVSGYHLLGEEILLSEGWLPLEDIQPEYDQETQYLTHDGYKTLEDKVIKKYRVEDIPVVEEVPPQPSEIEMLQEENERLKARLYATESTITETSSTQQDLVELLIDMGVI